MASFNKRLVLKILILRRLRKRLKRKQRCSSIRPIFQNRKMQGDTILLKELRDDPQYYFRYLRMNEESFDEILGLVSGKLTGSNTHSHPITAKEKLAITLRYLATGQSQVDLSFSYRISPSSVSKILREVFSVIVEILGPLYLPRPSQELWKKQEEGFRKRWNFPNCIGAVDGKHVRIQAPNFSGSNFYNYKGFFSVVLMAVVGFDYTFTLVDIGASGSQSDGGVFKRSLIGKSLDQEALNIPPPKAVGQQVLPHVFVADDAFALKKNLMKPYPGKYLTVSKRIYNYRLSRARNVVENSFGILAARWRIFRNPIIAELDLTKLIVHSSVILHNFLMAKKDLNTLSTDVYEDGCEQTGSWRNEVSGGSGLSSVRQQGSNNFCTEAASVRDSFQNFFNSVEGSVEWQMSRI